MPRLNENYYLRECYFKREQVPTQSVMMLKMTPPLASVYFKSMTPKLKILAGLEPPMKGGGSDWFVPPKDLLEGRAVMKPMKKEYLSKLGFNGIDFFGEWLVRNHRREMEEEKRQALLQSDIDWKKKVEEACRKQWEQMSSQYAMQNTQKILQAFQEFSMIYTTSLNKIESILLHASTKQIKSARKQVYDRMSEHYRTLLKQQATELYDKYTEKLMKEKARLKAQFIENVERSRTAMGEDIHDINYEKHVAIEKLRNLLECQNMACQVYVALKERVECQKEIDESKHVHKKKVKVLTEEIAIKDFEIKLAVEKEKKRKEFISIWEKKVCHVVKKFQLFVAYCLNLLPEHAEFFLNMEKLMLLQLNEAMENPSAESIFEPEDERFPTPIPRPHPMYLFCDRGFKPQIDQNLCPKHCTSSATQFPVIVIDNRCIYAACDKFEAFPDKIKDYISGNRGDDADVADDHDYTYDIPCKYTSTQQLSELKLESSLLQILQKDQPNVKQVPVECCVCKIPYCFCSPMHASAMSFMPIVKLKPSGESVKAPSNFSIIDTRSVELRHEREPKWESYFKYVEPKKCKCAKTAKKHLEEHMPAYMRKMSEFDSPDLPNYTPCSLTTLKRLVKKAKGRRTPPPEPAPAEPKTRTVSTQYEDGEFDYLCTCLSDQEAELIFEQIIKGSKLFEKKSADDFKIVGAHFSPTYLHRQSSSFATARAYSLRNLIETAPELEELFKKPDCEFE